MKNQKNESVSEEIDIEKIKRITSDHLSREEILSALLKEFSKNNHLSSSSSFYENSFPGVPNHYIPTKLVSGKV